MTYKEITWDKKKKKVILITPKQEKSVIVVFHLNVHEACQEHH